MHLASLRSLVAAALVAALAAGAVAAPKEITENVRYVGCKKGRYSGRAALLLVVAPERRAKNFALVVANQDFKGRNFDPPPEFVEFLQRLTPGDRLAVTYVSYHGQRFVLKVKPLKVKSVETPFFVYWETGTKRIGNQQVTYIVVGKGVETAEVFIPNVRGRDGKPTPDPKLTAKVAALNPGTPVDVKVRKAGRYVFLVDIGVYLKPLMVEFLRAGVAKMDERKHFAMAAKLHDREVVIPLQNTGDDPKKDPTPDPKLRDAVTALRHGQKIKIKIRLVEEKVYLNEIVWVDPIAKDAPKQPPKPRPEKDPEKPKPDTDEDKKP